MKRSDTGGAMRAATGWKLFVIAGALAWATACGTETGNPEALEVEYNARTTDPGAVALGEGDGAVVDEVWLRIDPVDLASECDGPVAASTAALGWSDHSGLDAVAQSVLVPDDTYCTVSTTFFADPAATGEPPELQGAAVALTGTLGDGRAFRVVVREDVAVRLTLDDEPLPEQGAWLLSFDVAPWLDVPALEALEGDPVVVDDSDNVEVLEAVIERLADGVQLHLDADLDGRVGPSERRLDR